MAIFSKEEMKRIIEENRLKTMDEVDEFITQLEKGMVEAILEGEMDTHLGYPRYDR